MNLSINIYNKVRKLTGHKYDCCKRWWMPCKKCDFGSMKYVIRFMNIRQEMFDNMRHKRGK